MTIPLPLTKKQLSRVVDQYATVFPGWDTVQGVALVRMTGPIQQQIGFQALRSGAYRPSHGVRALPLPSLRMLYQQLDIKHRDILPRRHESGWMEVVKAMEEQFRPEIRRPLDLEEVVTLCEAEATESTNDLGMLAILYATLGRKANAVDCCERMQSAPIPILAPRLDWEDRHIEFGRELVNALKAGTEARFLEEAVSRNAVY